MAWRRSVKATSEPRRRVTPGSRAIRFSGRAAPASSAEPIPACSNSTTEKPGAAGEASGASMYGPPYRQPLEMITLPAS